MKNLIKKLKSLAERNGIKFIEKANGHIQLQGQLLVNYYPFSKKKSVYIAGTKQKILNVTPERAIEMCNEAPIFRGLKDKRSGGSFVKRKKMFENGMKKCCWCGCSLTVQTSTIEHVIPLARGGLDNANNRKLACGSCNKKRGSNMPELDAVIT